MQILDVREKYNHQIKQLPNVLGLGIQEMGADIVLTCLVTQKVPTRTLRVEDRIPSNLDGYPVFVEEIWPREPIPALDFSWMFHPTLARA
jgi:hypothetical protein